MAIPIELPIVGVPAWVWGGLLVGAFVLLSVVTMAIARIPARSVPPPFEVPEQRAGDADETPKS